MKKHLKKAICCALSAVLISVLFGGCSFFSGQSDNLLASPRPSGDLSGIQKALNRELGSSFVLKYAKSGDYRSAYIVKDFDGDGESEAIAFYGVTDQKEEELHMTVIQNENGSWKIASDSKLGGTDIERVEFGDMNGDGVEEAVVAWSIYGSPETRLTVFDLGSTLPVELFEGSYTDFCVYDLNGDRCAELTVLSLDTIEKTASCSFFVYEKGNLHKTSTVAIDKSITSVKAIHKSSADGKPALYIDAYQDAGKLFTEVVVLEDGKLKAPLFDRSQQSSLITLRYQELTCGDADGDGNIEIPCSTVLPNGSTAADNALCLTEWKQYEKGTLTVRERSVVSKSLQYKFKIDKSWLGAFGCVATQKNDGIDFYDYNSKSGFSGRIFRLCAVNAETYSSEDFADWFILTQDYKKVYLAQITGQSEKLKISRSVIEQQFSERLVEENS